MEQEKKDLYEQVIEIEKKICDFFALNYDDVFSKSTKHDIVLARHLTIYLLHSCYQISWSKLAKRYKCSVRNIAYACANIGFYVNHDKKYRNYYKCLLQYINREE